MLAVLMGYDPALMELWIFDTSTLQNETEVEQCYWISIAIYQNQESVCQRIFLLWSEMLQNPMIF